MDRIERDIYVCRGTAPDPIEYPQGTNAIPLIFYMRDFTMPDDAVVAFYMKKPSGAVIFNAGEYINDTITIPMTTQMSAESGRMMATVHILQEDRVLNTFNIPVFVQKVAYDPDAIESTDEMTALDYLLEHAEEIITYLKAEAEGIISGLSEEAKTLLQQYIEILKRYEADYQEEFEEWFENLKYVLDGDVAGHLQVEIEAAQESADTALEQLATGIVNGYLPQDDDCYTLLTFGDDYAIILPKKICSCSGSAQAESGTTVSQSQVDDAVEKYMETHEIQTTPTDATLTKSGEAADAKVVGDKLAELQEGSGSASTVSVKVGSTSTGDPGTDAEVGNSGTDQDVVLNFTIPRGDQGEAGPQGEAGADGFSPTVEVSKSGKVTTITITDQAGSHSAEILDGEDGTGGGEGGTGADGYSPTVSVSKSDGVTTIVITDKNGDHTATINDGEQGPQGERGVQGEQGPQGEKGDTGAAGADGAAATIKVGTVTTGAAGSSASVTNSGTANAAVFDFVIPQGEQGGVSFGQRFSSIEEVYNYGISELSTYQMDFFGMSNASELTDGDNTNSCKGILCRQNTSIVDFLIFVGTGSNVYTGRISGGNLASWFKFSPDSSFEQRFSDIETEVKNLKAAVEALTKIEASDSMTSLIGF